MGPIRSPGSLGERVLPQRPQGEGIQHHPDVYAAKWLPTNRAGDAPFVDSGVMQPNVPYLDHVDTDIGIAEEVNVYVCLGSEPS